MEEIYETLFAMADRAMYATKREGKDHYSFAGKKQQEGAERERRRDRIEYAPESGQKVDKEFLNFAFSLLACERYQRIFERADRTDWEKIRAGLCHGV